MSDPLPPEQCNIPSKPTQDEITGAKWYSIGFLVVLLVLTIVVIAAMVSIWRGVLGA